jgi:hypothetical protein
MGPYVGDMKSGRIELRFAPADAGWPRGFVSMLRRYWWRWCSAMWVRQRIRDGYVVVVVGWAGTGKTSLCDRAGLTLMSQDLIDRIGRPELADRISLDRFLGKCLYVVDEVIAHPAVDLQDCLVNLRGRGFALVAQMCNDLDVRHITQELVYHHRVVVLHMNRVSEGDGPDARVTSEWVHRANNVPGVQFLA